VEATLTASNLTDDKAIPTKTVGVQATERQVFTNQTILAGATGYSNSTPGITDVSKANKVGINVLPTVSCPYTVAIRKRNTANQLIKQETISNQASDNGRVVAGVELGCMKIDWGIQNNDTVDRTFNAWEVLR
jgi:hypothetical protein